jgi:hypothetical protein
VKNRPNYCPNSLKNIFYNFLCEKVSKNARATFFTIPKTLAKVNIRPNGENRPNLVTLLPSIAAN